MSTGGYLQSCQYLFGFVIREKREITDFIEKMYGHHYSAGHVSNIGKLVDKDVKAFHNRRVKANYVVIYFDATWLPVRRDGVAKEALHVLVRHRCSRI